MTRVKLCFVRHIQDEFSSLKISRQRRYQLRRKRDGMCPQCDAKAVDGFVFCQECLIKKREWQRKYHGCVKLYMNAKSYKL